MPYSGLLLTVPIKNMQPGDPENGGGSIPAESAHTPLPDEVAESISGMLYLSEGEAPLRLLAADLAGDFPSLQQVVEARYGIPLSSQVIIPGEEFLAAIHGMADPSDPVMLEYTRRWDALFALLRGRAKELSVIRGGAGELQLFIAAFGSDAPVIIHTTAIET